MCHAEMEDNEGSKELPHKLGLAYATSAASLLKAYDIILPFNQDEHVETTPIPLPTTQATEQQPIAKPSAEKASITSVSRKGMSSVWAVQLLFEGNAVLASTRKKCMCRLKKGCIHQRCSGGNL